VKLGKASIESFIQFLQDLGVVDLLREEVDDGSGSSPAVEETE
jgi:hypothetical protein